MDCDPTNRPEIRVWLTLSLSLLAGDTLSQTAIEVPKPDYDRLLVVAPTKFEVAR